MDIGKIGPRPGNAGWISKTAVSLPLKANFTHALPISSFWQLGNLAHVSNTPIFLTQQAARVAADHPEIILQDALSLRQSSICYRTVSLVKERAELVRAFQDNAAHYFIPEEIDGLQVEQSMDVHTWPGIQAALWAIEHRAQFDQAIVDQCPQDAVRTMGFVSKDIDDKTTYRASDPLAFYAALTEFAEQFKLGPKERFLELGCAGGSNVFIASIFFKKALGVDGWEFAIKQAEMAKKTARKQGWLAGPVSFKKDFYENLPLRFYAHFKLIFFWFHYWKSANIISQLKKLDNPPWIMSHAKGALEEAARNGEIGCMGYEIKGKSNGFMLIGPKG